MRNLISGALGIIAVALLPFAFNPIDYCKCVGCAEERARLLADSEGVDDGIN